MKIYISGKMGRPVDKEIKKKFYKVYFTLLEKHDLTPNDIVNPASDYYQARLKGTLESHREQDEMCGRPFDPYRENLLYDMCQLRQCDAIYMLKDWTFSPGARAEHEFAKAIGLEVMYEEEYIDMGMRECIDELIGATEDWGSNKGHYTMEKAYGKWDVTLTVAKHKE